MKGARLLVTGNQYPIYKASTTPEIVRILPGSPYVIHSAIQGFVPAINIKRVIWTADNMSVQDPSSVPQTMIINQMSVGKALFHEWRTGGMDGLTLSVSRVAEGKTAPYKIVIMNPDRYGRIAEERDARPGESAGPSGLSLESR